MNMDCSIRKFSRTLWALAIALGLLAAAATAETVRLTLLHTNDLHDHVRPGYEGFGGLPYVSGYVQAARAETPDLVLLDAGDVTEKGDLVAFRTGGVMTYEAMRRIGYDAVTIGNHDHDAGLAGLRRFEAALGEALVCLNRVDAKGEALFPGSRIVEAAGLRLGIIGLLVPQDEGTLDAEESGRALARECARLAPEVDLLIALCHEGPDGCREWSRAAPAVDLFVSGHSHDRLDPAVPVPETGAWIVQAGSYARWVGRLELEVDRELGRILKLDSKLIELRAGEVPIDREMAAWVAARERELCPEASQVLFDNDEELGRDDLAWLGAEALRQAAGTEIAFCHGGQVIRGLLPAGPVDVNAVFLTGGHRAHDNLQFELTGSEIQAYLAALAEQGQEPTNWSGFRATIVTDASGRRTVRVDLQPERHYSVLMPQLEWDTRFDRMVRRYRERGLGGALVDAEVTLAESAVTFTGAMADYLPRVQMSEGSLREALSRVRREAGDWSTVR